MHVLKVNISSSPVTWETITSPWETKWNQEEGNYYYDSRLRSHHIYFAKEGHRVGYTKYQQTLVLQIALNRCKKKLDSFQPFKLSWENEFFETKL